jgi:hypothetical protein
MPEQTEKTRPEPVLLRWTGGLRAEIATLNFREFYFHALR